MRHLNHPMHKIWRMSHRLAILPYSCHQRWLWQSLTKEIGARKVRCIWDLKQAPIKRALKHNGATLVTYMLCLSEDFCPIKIRSLRFLRIFSDESFLPFLSLIAKIRMYYCRWECRNTTVWVFNRDRKFKVGIASRETIRFLTLRQLIVSKIWRIDVKCVMLQSYANFQVGPDSALDAAYFPTHFSHLSCHERSG